MDWTSNQAIAVYILLGVVAAAVVAFLVLKKTVRTRLTTQRQIEADPDINEWLVIFDWSNKILYVPLILISIIAGILVASGVDPAWVGGVWFVVLLLNFLVGEYEINMKVIIIGLLCIALLLLWLHLLGWVEGFVKIFRNISVALNETAYFLVAVLGLLAIGISWVKGLFFYVALTPNYMNIQEGPTETGEHIGQEDYNSRVNTQDFLERLMGFGRIIIIFKDRKRQPMSMLVWGIRRKAASLEAIRGTISVEQHLRGGAAGEPVVRTSTVPEPESESAGDVPPGDG